MVEHNARNERIKRQYRTYQLGANRRSGATVDAMMSSIDRFERFMSLRYFGDFTYEQAIAFKEHIASSNSQVTQKKLSVATVNSLLNHLKQFFMWLSTEQAFQGRVIGTHADYFNLSAKDARVATARREVRGPTVEQVHMVLSLMPKQTVTEMRDRALIAFGLLTGARADAIASFRLKHVNLETCSVFQDAREVRTKNSKSFSTAFFPVGGEAAEIFGKWVLYLREELGWSDEDPLFPTTIVARGNKSTLEVVGVVPQMWSTTSPIRRIYRKAFEAGGLPYFNPHSFRNTLVRLGYAMCKTPEQFAAWSQNLGHESILTTIDSYGTMTDSRRENIMSDLRAPSHADGDVQAALHTLMKHLTPKC